MSRVFDLKAFLRKLHENLNILQEREAKYGGNAPLDLLNQIKDHQEAIAVTEQAITNALTEAEWREALKPLLVSLKAHIDEVTGGVSIGDVYGDIRDSVIVGRDLVLQMVQQAGLELPQRDLAGQLAVLEQALPHFDAVNKVTAQATLGKLKQAIAALPAHEQQYLQRLKERYGEDVIYYVSLAGETTEVISPAEAEVMTPRSARRRRQRALAEYHEWIPMEREIKRVRLNTLREGVDKYPCLILLGDPGSGKTTALEHLAYEFVDESDWLPLPLRLSEFGPGLTLEEFIAQGWGGSEKTGHWEAPELAANLEGYLKAGQLFVLFDALNEMPHQGYTERALALRRFIDKWSAKGNRFLVTCRVLDYGEELSGLQRVEVQPLNDEQIQTFLRNELPQTWQALWQRLAEGAAGQRRLLEMARNPYLLTMMIDIFVEDGKLGRSRAELMTRFTQILMEWAKAKCAPEEWLDADVQREALAVLAFEAQARAGFGTRIKTEQVKAVIPRQVQPDPAWPPVLTPPEQVLRLAVSANIIEMPVGRSSVRFYHQLLQEYFAARAMLKRDPASLTRLWSWPWLETELPLWVRPQGNDDPLPPPPPTGWEETTILATGLALENDDQLVQALLQVNPVLAGRCVYEGQAKVDETIRQAVIARLLLTMARSEVALRVRIAAGEVLGYLGDPRLGEMVTVPAGEFLMGEGQKEHRLLLPDYQIGKYPLTHEEYGRFIEAGGYKKKRWWTEAWWKEKEKLTKPWWEPRFWDDSRYNKPNQPVVGVSWYECVAYCCWLSAETGQSYRLPTEAEWEKAARGPEGRQYPWGNQFEASRLNALVAERRVSATTPVGIYPKGASPYRVLDMAGNVWEWCATKWGKPYPYEVTEDEWTDDYLKGSGTRVLRGGSWYDSEYSARCAYRFRRYPSSRLYYWGCRVVVSPIL